MCGTHYMFCIVYNSIYIICSSSTLALSSTPTEYYPLRKYYSTSDLVTPTYYDDVRDYYRYRPWLSNYYPSISDELWSYRLSYGSKYYPYRYFPSTRTWSTYLEPSYSYYSYPRYYRSSWYDDDPLLYRRSYYYDYYHYPYRYWTTPSYYESNYYRYRDRPYYPYYSYSWQYPRRYLYDYYY